MRNTYFINQDRVYIRISKAESIDLLKLFNNFK